MAEEITLKELMEQVVHDEFNEITAFRVVLNSFLEKNVLSQKVPVDDAFNSASDLLSLVSVLRKHLEQFNRQYGVHLVGYATLEKIEKLFYECSAFHELLSLQKELDTGVQPRSPIHTSSVADFVLRRQLPRNNLLNVPHV